MFKNVLRATISAVALLAIGASHGHAEILEIPLTKVGDNYGLMTKVNGQAVVMVLDTGAESVCLPYATAYQLIQAGRMTPSEIGGYAAMGGASGEITQVGKVMLREVSLTSITGLGWQMSNVPALVGCDVPLLGQKFLRSLQSYSINNASNMLVLTTPPTGSAMPGYKADATSPAPTYTPPLPEVLHYSLPSYGNPAPGFDEGGRDRQAFDEGGRDRKAWEDWYNGLPEGQYKEGAFYWSSVRSRPEHVIGCRGTGYTGTPDQAQWANGCDAGKSRLDPADYKRLTNPSYRAGWNSYSGPGV